jgi:hypothetical protein
VAVAKIIHRFSDGTSTELVVSIKADGPDALDECVRRVSDLWRLAMTEGESEGTP